MGLLSRIGRGLKVARGHMDDGPGALESTLSASLAGGALGAGGGFIANGPWTASPDESLDAYGSRLLRGMGTGAAIGAGATAGLVGAQGARGFARGFAKTAAEQLDELKQEALERWARNAPDNIKQQIANAQTPDEVTQLVEWVVSRTPVRNRAGGF